MYKCYSCGKQFISKRRVDIDKLWSEYVYKKQTLEQLANEYKLNISTIRRYLSQKKILFKKINSRPIIALVDSIYFGTKFGVCVIKDAITGDVLWRKYIKNETLKDYQEGLSYLEKEGFEILGVVCDGKRGMFNLFSKYKVQMCQFHQVQIVVRYITTKPKLQASIDFKYLIHLLVRIDKESFIYWFDSWYFKWKDFINERRLNHLTGKKSYVHRRLRSAYLSVKRNMDYLWTWYDYIELGIPNTNNQLEGSFTDLKNKLRNHNGMNIINRKQFIDEFLLGIEQPK